MIITGLTLVCLLWTMFVIAACGGGDHAVEWGYHGPGAPENWASLSEEYATCADGERQSPLDITSYEEGDAGPISFSYESDATLVRNDGKFVHVDYAPGNTISLGQRTFELKSAHLHSPSEHRIDGASFAAEMHLVHAGVDGHLAVVALLFRLGRTQPCSASDSRCRPGCRRYRQRRHCPRCQRRHDWRARLLPATTARRRPLRAMSRLTGM